MSDTLTPTDMAQILRTLADLIESGEAVATRFRSRAIPERGAGGVRVEVAWAREEDTHETHRE